MHDQGSIFICKAMIFDGDLISWLKLAFSSLPPVLFCMIVLYVNFKIASTWANEFTNKGEAIFEVILAIEN